MEQAGEGVTVGEDRTWVIGRNNDRRSRGRPTLMWLGGNWVIGYCAILPAIEVWHLVYYFRALLWNSVLRPFGTDAAAVTMIFVAVAAAIHVTVTIFFNRWVWRRLRSRFPQAPPGVHMTLVGFWFASLAFQCLPYWAYYCWTDRTVFGVFGRGLFW